jgi:hypothetical protein
MKRKTHWILYGICLPWDLVAYLVVLLIRVLWGKGLRWETPPYAKERGGGPCLTCQIKEGSLPVRKGIFPVGWYLHDPNTEPPTAWGGTTLGHGIFYGPRGRFDDDPNNPWCSTQEHEHYHVEQHEAAMVGSFISGLAAFIVLLVLGHPVAAVALGMGLWASGYLLMGTGGWVAALLRGEAAYWGSQHEESARAQTEVDRSAR